MGALRDGAAPRMRQPSTYLVRRGIKPSLAAGGALVGSSGPRGSTPRLLRTRVPGSTDLDPRPLDYQGSPDGLFLPRYEPCSRTGGRRARARVRSRRAGGPRRPPLRVEVEIYLSACGMPTSPGSTKMVAKTAEAWTVSILAVLGLVIALNSLGLSVPGLLGAIVHGAERILNSPI